MPGRPDILLGRPTEADSFARRPANFADSPERPLDAFSEILSGVKLNGAVFFSAEFSAPWFFSTPPTSAIATELAPGTERLELYRPSIAHSSVSLGSLQAHTAASEGLRTPRTIYRPRNEQNLPARHSKKTPAGVRPARLKQE